MKSAPHLLVFDGFADWEAAYATAELRRSGNQQVVTVGYSGEPVVSMGAAACFRTTIWMRWILNRSAS